MWFWQCPLIKFDKLVQGKDSDLKQKLYSNKNFSDLLNIPHWRWQAIWKQSWRQWPDGQSGRQWPDGQSDDDGI